MKKYIFLLCALVISFASCEDIQDNDPVIQANIDSLFFKSFGTNGIRTDDGVTLEGLTDDQRLTLFINRFDPGTYAVGPEERSFAVFENDLGAIYSTNFEGSQGEIIITNTDLSAQTVTGTFQFTAVFPNVDTIFVDKGVFFDVPYQGVEDSNNSGTFSASVDETPFNATLVVAVDSGNSLLISGSIGSRSILIRVPLDVEVGNYSVPSSGFVASYSVGTDSEEATDGNISVISHDIPNRTISGTFSFVTPNFTISGGQFNVSY